MTLVLINTSETDKQVELNLPVRPEEFTSYRTSATENAVETGVVTNAVGLPGLSITTLEGYGLSGPAIDEIPNHYFFVGDVPSLEIPLSGISNGGGGSIDFLVTSSNESVVSFSNVDYTHPDTDGTLTLVPNTGAPGSALVTVKISNENNVDGSSFGFNSSEVSFIVEVIDLVTSSNEQVSPKFRLYPNPVNAGKLILDLSSFHGSPAVEITNAMGEPVLNFKRGQLRENEVTIDTNGWRPGLYLLKISSGKKKFIEKIIVR
jgi:hypothetical protein